MLHELSYNSKIFKRIKTIDKIYQKYPLIIILIFTLFSFISIAMIKYSYTLGYNMSAKHSVLVDASMEAKYELTTAHLWLEEYLDGDRSITKAKIKKHIDEAKWYLNAMIYGDKNTEGDFLAIDKRDSSLILDIKQCLILIDSFEKKTNLRILNNAQSGSKLDIEYDKLYEKTINKIDIIETKLQEMISKDLNYYEWIHYLLVVGIVLINLFILFSYKTILKYQKEWLLKYFKVETEKKKLEYESTHDNLTSIYNRNKFDEILEYEMSQYKRYEKVFSLAIIDLDHFKNVNDNYGHHTGDEVLIQTVKIINKSIRSTDVLARWGGEEFILLLPYTSISQSKIVVEKVRKAIETYKFEKVGNLTVSIGLSEVNKNDTSLSIFERIDSALYEAKESGRNKVIISQENKKEKI